MYENGRILVLGYSEGVVLGSTKIRFFFYSFVQFLSKTAAKISRSLVMVALRKLHHQRNFLRSTRWCNPFWATPARRDFDRSQGHYSSVPKMSQKQRVFGYFSATTGWNYSRFSAFATLYPILTENRRAKPGRIQIRSLKITFKLHL